MKGLTNPFPQQTHYRQTSRDGKQTQQCSPPEEQWKTKKKKSFTAETYLNEVDKTTQRCYKVIINRKDKGTHDNPYVQGVCTRMVPFPIDCNNNSVSFKCQRIQHMRTHLMNKEM